MHKLLLAGVAAIALAAASPVMAQNTTGGAVVGGTAGAATGGTIGFFLGGPVGAVIGGFAGAVIGAEAGVSAATVAYTAEHPVDPIYLEDNIDVGYRVSDNVKVYPVEGDDAYGYFYANNRVYIVDRASGEVVQSPGYLIPQHSVDYAMANPTADVNFSGDLAPGARFEGNVSFGEIPEDPAYSYVYVDGRPVLVDRRSQLVVWVG